MDEEANSWIRRTKFSHTVCHRFDASRLASVPFTIQPTRVSSVKSGPEAATVNLITKQNVVQIQQNNTKQRAISPTPETKLSDTFKEARSIQKRFSTPNPRRKDQEKKIDAKVNKNSQEINPLRHLTSMKFHGKFKSRRESASGKYFDHVGGNKVVSVETGDEHMVELSKLYIGLRFAHGAHSQLYHGVYMDKPVAVKMIYVPDNDENGALGAQLEKQFTREVTLLSRLHHPNIIKFVGGCRKPSVFCIVTEYLPEGSLRTYLHRLEKKPIPLQNLITMALDIARGMEFIHSQGVIHRDLKPENVLITEDFHLKIADFGIACEEAHCDLLADPGTYLWMAPQMIKKKNYGRKVDVYGFGLILWEFVAGTIPYEDMIPIQAAFAVLNKNLRPDVPINCPPAMKALIEQCWSLKPNKRPEFWQIVKILEEFKASFDRDGTLEMVQNPTFQDPKKGFRHWIQKLDQNHQRISYISKPKFI